MIVKITNSCRMGCTHCCENSKPDNSHMSLQLVDDTIKFILSLKYKPRVTLISGGEPTDHPDFIEILEKFKKLNSKLVITTNGMFISENKELRRYLSKQPVYVQITNDKKYYPKPIVEYNYKNFVYENTLRIIAPFGRAKINNLECNRSSPYCFNYRSFCKSGYDFETTIYQLETMGKYCTPMVINDGSIALGEMSSCYKIGNIYDNIITLNKNIALMKCNRCGLFNTIDDKYRNLLNE